MRKRRLFVVCALLFALVLTGCAALEKARNYFVYDYVAFSDMVYERPSVEQIEEALQEAIAAAQGEDPDRIMDRIYHYYDYYDGFFTNYNLADIFYSKDMTDLYWEAEYDFCLTNSASVDEGLEQLYYALAQSPCLQELEGEDYFGPGFFDSYKGENEWDEVFTQLLEQESALIMQYYEQTDAAAEHPYASAAFYEACGDDLAQLLIELVQLRQQMAAYFGYGNYAQMAHELYYSRDYTLQQATDYCAEVARELTPLYQSIWDDPNWDIFNDYCPEAETYNYVRAAAKAMGGRVEESFDLMSQAGLYDISYGENKYNGSFEVYLYTYWQPYVFVSPTLTAYDKMTFAHEFGHFCNDYATYGPYASTDVAEVFSQGMEYLSLVYADAPQALVWMKMADSLCTFVEQAAFATFEQRLYELEPSELTVQSLRKLYSDVAREFGFDSGELSDYEFVTVNHFYEMPMYVISYAVSADVALQMYQLELEETGAGLKCFEENLDTTAYTLLEFVESTGLESPFSQNRLAQVRRTLEAALKSNNP